MTIVDERCVLPEGFSAGFDAEQDSKRGITLTTPEMLEQRVNIAR